MVDRASNARKKIEEGDNERRGENRNNKCIDIYISWNQFLDIKSFLFSKEEHTWKEATESEPICVDTNAGIIKFNVRTLG